MSQRQINGRTDGHAGRGYNKAGAPYKYPATILLLLLLHRICYANTLLKGIDYRPTFSVILKFAKHLKTSELKDNNLKTNLT